MYRCLARGLSFKVGQGNVIVLAPPLIIEEADLERALEIVEQAILASGVMLIVDPGRAHYAVKSRDPRLRAQRQGAIDD